MHRVEATKGKEPINTDGRTFETRAEAITYASTIADDVGPDLFAYYIRSLLRRPSHT